MEKYSNWTEQKIGRHPYLPSALSKRSILGHVLVFPLALIRLPVFLVLTLLLAFLDAVLALVLPFAFLQRPVCRLVDGILGRFLLLICFGITSVGSTTVRLRRGVRGASKTLPNVPAGALILSNHVSALDLLILHTRFSPVFALPSGSGDADSTRYCAQSWSGALLSLRGDHVSSANSPAARPLAEIQRAAQQQGRPVVVLVEGATSNGQLVLGCSALDPQCLEGDAPAPAIVALVYGSAHSPTLGTRRFSAHLFWDLLGTFRHPVVVRQLHPDDFPQEMQGEQMLDALAGCARLRRGVQLPKDKLEFLAYWRKQH